jgi:hypothetical protein
MQLGVHRGTDLPSFCQLIKVPGLLDVHQVPYKLRLSLPEASVFLYSLCISQAGLQETIWVALPGAKSLGNDMAPQVSTKGCCSSATRSVT